MSSTSASPLESLTVMLKSDMAVVNDLIYARMNSDIALIPQLAGYLIASGGKRIRPLLTLACARLFETNTDQHFALAAAVEFIHTATLLHDDVVDESDQRRGQASANRVFGNQQSVLVGDFLFSRAFELMVESGSLDVLRILAHASAVIAEGEVLQLSIQNDLSVNLEQYLKVIEGKTAELFASACEVAPVIAEQNAATCAAIRAYGYNLGMAFQIADDILDYQADAAELGKSIGDDFKEGKMTALVIYALEQASDAEKQFWQEAFASGEADLTKAQALIKNHQADLRAYALAESYALKAAESLRALPDTDIKRLLIDLAHYAVQRRK